LTIETSDSAQNEKTVDMNELSLEGSSSINGLAIKRKCPYTDKQTPIKRLRSKMYTSSSTDIVLPSPTLSAKNTTSFEQNSKIQQVVRPSLQPTQKLAYESHIQDLDKRLTREPSDKLKAQLLGLKGAFIQKLGHYEESVPYFNESIRLDPTVAFSFTRKGESLRLLHQYSESIQIFKAAMKIDSNNSFLNSRFGAVLYDSDTDLNQAEKYITKAYQSNSTDIITVQYAMKLKIFARLHATQKSKSIQPVVMDPDILFRSGYHAFKQKSYCKAKNFFTQALQVNSNHLQSLIYRAKIFLKNEDYPNAKNDFEIALTVDPKNPGALLGLATCYLVEKNPYKGIQLLDTLLNDNPGKINARITRGEEYRKLKRHQEAFDDFDTAIQQIENYNTLMAQISIKIPRPFQHSFSHNFDEDIPQNPYEKHLVCAYGRRGMLTFLLNPNKLEETLSDFEKANEIDPNDVFVWSARGTIEYERGDFSGAKYFFYQCLQQSPSHTHSLNCLGEIFRFNKDYCEAKKYFTQSININNNNYFAYERLGDIYRNLEEYEEALKCLTKAIQLKPNSHFALSSRGDLFRNLQRLHEAYTDINEALNIRKTAFNFANLGEVYRLNGHDYFTISLQAYNQAIRLDKEYSFTYFCKAKLFTTCENYEQALTNLNISFRLDRQQKKPVNVLALLLRANIHLNQENYEDAAQNLIAAENVGSQQSLTQKYWTMYHYRCGNLPEALNSITIAIEKSSTHEAAHYAKRAKIHFFLRNFSEANNDIHTSLQLDDSQPMALSLQGIFQFLNEQYDMSIATLKKAIVKDPRSGFSHSALGEVYRITGQYQLAKEEFNLGIRYSSKSPVPYLLRGILHFETGEPFNALDDFEKYQTNSLHYTAPLTNSKGPIDTLVACMQLIIHLQSDHTSCSKDSIKKHKKILSDLSSKIPNIKLKIFDTLSSLPSGEISLDMKNQISETIQLLKPLTQKNEKFYALSSLSILYALLGDDVQMKSTVCNAFNTLKLMPSYTDRT
jgi:tetratricopeptide (TPR) repeat protein